MEKYNNNICDRIVPVSGGRITRQFNFKSTKGHNTLAALETDSGKLITSQHI